MKAQAASPTFLQRLKSGSRAAWAVALGGAAMLLILLSELWPAQQPAAAAGAETTAENTAAAYQQQLEQRLASLISQLDGAGSATVMVTLETGEETVYALDTLSGQTQSQQTHVLLDDGTALKQTVYSPQVRGVAVVCDGGGDVSVAARITELLSALLDIPTNRICVEQRSG